MDMNELMNEGIHLDLDTWIVPGQVRWEVHGATELWVFTVVAACATLNDD